MFMIIGIAVLLLLAVSLLHLYWAYGGRWGSSAALPTREGTDRPLFVPRKPETVAVALVLALLSLLLPVQWGQLPIYPADALTRWACGLAAAVFALRVIGDFRYLGLFKRVRGTPFAYYDTRLFIPLCAYLSFAFTLAFLR